MISKKFLKTSFLYTITGSLPLASQLILLPFYTNNLSTANFGYLGLYIGFSQLIQILVTFSFDSVLASHYYEYKNDVEKLKRYISSVLIMILLLGFGIVLLLLPLGEMLFEIIGSNSEMSFYPYGLISVFTGIFNSLFKVATNLLMVEQKAEKYAFVNILNSVLIISLSLLGLQYFPNTLVGPMWGRFISGGVSFLLLFLSITSVYGYKFDFKHLKTTLPFNLSIFLVSVISWVVTYIDRYIINYYMTPSDVGVYDFAARATIGIEIVMGALFNATIPPIYNIWSSNNKQFSTLEVNRYYNVLTSICILLIALTMVGLPIIIPFLVKNKSYYTAFEYIPIISLSFITQVIWQMHSLPIMYEKRGDVLPKILVINCIFKIVLSVLLIKYFGLIGAVWTLFISKVVHIGSIAIVSQKMFPQEYNKVKILLLPLLYSVLVIISNQFLPNQYELLYHVAETLIFLIIMFLVFRNEIIIVLRKYNLKI